MTLLRDNIRLLRKRKGWTQQDLADSTGLKRSLIGAYEEGRAEPSVEKLIGFSEVFNVSVDDLVGIDLSQSEPGSTRFKVLSITVDEDDKENIELVPQKAAAGYLNGYSDPEFIKELPRFKLPFLSDSGTYRAFEISGDSMLPIVPGTIIIGQYVERVNDIKNGKTYLLVTKKEGVVFKRVFNYIEEKGKLYLVSDNKQYSSYETDPDEILEIWSSKAYISVEFPDPPEDRPDISVDQLTSIVMDLKNEVNRLKGG
ncbi:MAG: helix-turn-helix domain-containing protein [Saprospiraceae bacterium]|nr:helix-turn-helix domain-containing protein [Saprospiraceae bacterium]